MPIHNSEIADTLTEIADLLEIDGANAFRVRAYRQASQGIEGLSENLKDKVEQGEDLTKIQGIGKSVAEKIQEYVNTGKIKKLDEVRKKVPVSLRDLLGISGLGPERVRELYQKLNVKTIEDLKKAADNHQIQELPNFGEKLENKIAHALEKYQKDKGEKRFELHQAADFVDPLVEYLQNQIKNLENIDVAGSYRRKKETVGDIDIVISCDNHQAAMKVFTSYDEISEILWQGETKSSIVLRSGLQVDLRVVDEHNYGAAINYFTGSQAHNIRLRERGNKRNLKLNEYGLFPEGKDEPVAAKTEEEIYKALDLPYIAPELRENRGEIEAAENGNLPQLIEISDIKGDLHSHSTYTDGKDSIKNMAEAAKKMGYKYLALTDHSKRVTVAGGLNESQLAEEIDQIDAINENLEGFRILKGIEVDILEDGSLDLSDDILKRLDLTVCSAHYNHDLNRDKQMKRHFKAMDNPYCNIIGHPTGRIIQKRDEMDMDMETLMDAALERNVVLELNSTPKRLDIKDIYCKMAKDKGVKLVISTDAHSTDHFQFIKYGIGQARRGWLEADNVINTRNLKTLQELIKR